MVIILYHFTGNNVSMSKSLEVLSSEITIVPTQGISLMGGELIIDYSSVFSVDWDRVNYMYLSIFSRYYFVKNVVLDIGKQVILSTQVDPLYTFAGQIKNCPATCLRTEKYKKPSYFPDSQLPVIPNQNDAHSTVFDLSPFDVEAEYSYIVGVLSKSEGGE